MHLIKVQSHSLRYDIGCPYLNPVMYQNGVIAQNTKSQVLTVKIQTQKYYRISIPNGPAQAQKS